MAPENTIKAFRRAVAEGADGIEFDVIVTKDGKPVVVHDDELNRNVEGAQRKGHELGKVSEKTLEEVQQYNVGQGEKIPSLKETLDFITEANAERAVQGKPPLIVNVELKTKGTTEMAPIADMVHEYTSGGKIANSDVIFCSFDHEQLAALKTQHPEFQIAPSIKTATLYGKDNITMPGFKVKPGAQYDPQGLKYLQDFHNATPTVAMDAVFWDVDHPLIDLAKKNGIAIHASTSDYRDYGENASLTTLHHISQDVPLYFKADEPAQVRQQLNQIKQKFSEVNFSGTTPAESQTLSTVNRDGLKVLPLEKPVSYSEKILSRTTPQRHDDKTPPSGSTPSSSQNTASPDASGQSAQAQSQGAGTQPQGQAQGANSQQPSAGGQVAETTTETPPPAKVPVAALTEAAVVGTAVAVKAAETHTESHSTPRLNVKIPSGAGSAIKAANAPIGVAMGAKGLYDKLGNKDSDYHKDVAAGGTRKTMANVGLGADVANLTVGTVQSAHDISQVAKGAKAAGVTAEAAEGATGALGVAGEVAGRVAIPLAVVAGAAETGAAIAGKDGHRAAKAAGSTVGGILGGMAAGAAVGSIIPGAGTVVGAAVGLAVGIGGALLGSWLGGKAADATVGDWADKKLHENDKPTAKSPAEIAKEQEMGQWQSKLDSYTKALTTSKEADITANKTQYEAYLNDLKAKGYIDDKAFKMYSDNSQKMYDNHEKALKDAKKATANLQGTHLQHADKPELSNVAPQKSGSLSPQL
jgi:glycerophosphoryl diester phosphodiesterase